MNRSDRPIDPATVAADDALLDNPAAYGGELAGLLAGWRTEVHSVPSRELVDTDTALAAIDAGRHPHKREGTGAAGWALFAVLIVVILLALFALAGCTPTGGREHIECPGGTSGLTCPTVTAPAAPPLPIGDSCRGNQLGFCSGSSAAVDSLCSGEKPGICPGTPTPLPYAMTITAPWVIPANNHVTGTYPGHCISTDGEPDATCTPGSVRSDITEDNIGATICNPDWSTRSIRAPQSETDRVKTASMNAYGIPESDRAVTELDHDVPLELAGSNATSNLWAQRSDEPGKGFRNHKDGIENRLHAAVCGHRVTLRAAQVAIATDWRTAERRLGLAA